MRFEFHRLKSVPLKPGNHVLMFVVRKLDCELAFCFRFQGLIRTVRITESEACCFARGGFWMAHRADCRTGPNHRLAREELLPMTTNAGGVFGKISNIGKVSLGCPSGRNLMAFIASKALVFIR